MKRLQRTLLSNLTLAAEILQVIRELWTHHLMWNIAAGGGNAPAKKLQIKKNNKELTARRILIKESKMLNDAFVVNSSFSTLTYFDFVPSFKLICLFRLKCGRCCPLKECPLSTRWRNISRTSLASLMTKKLPRLNERGWEHVQGESRVSVLQREPEARF